MIKGSIVALVTPMLEDGRVDWAALERLVEFHIRSGTDAIVSVGTTGESPTLDFEEHIQVIAQTIKWAAGRLPVIAGTGSNSTQEAIELTQASKERGADACLLVTPYYNKPTQEGLYQHHKAIAEAVAIPQILYNVPGRTVCDMQTATVERLMKLPHIVGIKDATGDLERARALLEITTADFAVYSGDDETAVELILLGGQGNISVTANVAPEAVARMCQLALSGEQEKARSINQQLMPLHKALFKEANPIPVKWALYEMGLIKQGIRLPLTPLSESLRPELKQALGQVNG